MLPDRCSVVEDKKGCASPPEHVITIVSDDGEYMVGVACSRHKGAVSAKIGQLQKDGKMRAGRVAFSPVRPVGTDCVKGSPDDLIQL